MKILQFVDVPWDSGLANYALVLAQGLQAKGHKVFVSAVPGEKPWLKAKRLGLRTVPLATLKSLTALRRFLAEHKIQTLNAHTGSTHSLAVAAALGNRVAVIRTRSDARPVKRRVGGQFLFKHTQRVITAADYIRQTYLQAVKLSPKKVVTIYQGLSLEEFSLQKFPGKPVLGIVARLDPVKGHRYLLEALVLLKGLGTEVHLKIIGQEENIKERELRVLAERLRIDRQVDFAGYQKDIPRAMADCSIGVIASTGSEAVSRVALEWMACGRPVIATRVGCLPEMVEEGKNGLLVPPRDAPALARAIASLVYHPALIQSMGAAARTFVEKRFSFPEFVTRTETVYKEAWDEVQCQR